jgi:hypothetical protein
MQLLLQDPLGKLARSEQGEIAAEREQEDGINSCAGQQTELFGSWSKEFKSSVGSKDTDGMRLEGDGHGLRVLLPGAVSDISQDGLMSPVDAVKIAHAEDRGAEGYWNVFEFVEDLHGCPKISQKLTAECAKASQ